jgi:very-short-patch-repair endonuclease
MPEELAKADARMAVLAARQHGVVSTAQLRALGLSYDSIHRRASNGRLHRLHRGVYAVGHRALSWQGRYMAAVLVCGADAAVSHRSAAALWRMLPFADGPVHVCVSSDSGRARRAGIRIHRTGSLMPRDLTVREGVPVTSPSRTLADLKRAVPATVYRRALRQAEVLGLPLGEAASDGTRSELERAFLTLCGRHGLPRPEVNARVGPYLVDFLWRGKRLVVETDGYRYHRGRTAFEQDRARDLYLREQGYDVLRLSFRQVGEEPVRVAGLLRRRVGVRRGG